MAKEKNNRVAPVQDDRTVIEQSERTEDGQQVSDRQQAPQIGVNGKASEMQQKLVVEDLLDRAEEAAALAPKKIGKEQVRKAMETLRKYKQGKQNLETRIIKNEEWFKQRHWKFLEDKSTQNDPKPASGWLFNTIVAKHADFMDSYPKSDILPREMGDRAEALKLSSIIPVVMDQNDYESEYSDEVWYKLKNGTGVFGVFWDQNKLNGLGDISIKSMDLLQLFWEPGVKDIQRSQNLFSVELVDNEVLKNAFPDIPELKTQLNEQNESLIKKYWYDDKVDTTGKSLVVDWYYKKSQNGKTLLHYCKFVDEIVLYATENDNQIPTAVEMMPITDENNVPILDEMGQPELAPVKVPTGQPRSEVGWYDHGLYPFVFDVLFKEEGMPVGFGFVDICKEAQTSIDILNNAIEKNALFNATPRYFTRSDGGVNEEEFMTPNKMLVHVDGVIDDNNIMPVAQTGLSGNYIDVLNNKISEMKETTGNRDTSNGGTTAGVTAASAIAAMQEQAGKTSRDMIKTTYRSHKAVVNMVIELIRQFYDMPRTFRIMGEYGTERYISYENSGLKLQYQGNDFGEDMGYRLPVFDIKVTAEKESPYSQLSQNELALQFYGAGFFDPTRTDQALAALDMMEFQGKDEVLQKISANGTLYQRLIETQQMVLQLAQIVDKNNGTALADGIAGSILQEGSQPISTGHVSTPDIGGESSITQNARQQAAATTQPR